MAYFILNEKDTIALGSLMKKWIKFYRFIWYMIMFKIYPKIKQLILNAILFIIIQCVILKCIVSKDKHNEVV